MEPASISWDQVVLYADRQFEIQDMKTLSWMGAKWRLLTQFNDSFIGVFVVCAEVTDTDPNWFCSLEFVFSILDPQGIVLNTKCAFYQFERPKDGETPVDRGYRECFSHAEARACRRADSTIIIRCELYVHLPKTIGHLQQADASKLSTGMVGLENLGATCYLNALLQMLFHINMFRKEVYNLPHEQQDITTSTTLAMQSVFFKLQTENRVVSTSELTRSFGWNSADAFQQQDVQEMMRVLIDKLEEYMKGTARENALKATFAGSIRSYIRCLNIDYVSQREEDFYDIQLDVKGHKNIYESFDAYIAKEMLDKDNQYDAGEGRGKQDAEKGVIFTKFPPVLTIHLKRFAFDMQKMGFTKIHDRFEYPLVLDLNPYVASDVAELTDVNENIYRLHSVLVHSGEVYGGHYYAYIRAMPCLDSTSILAGAFSSWLGDPPGPDEDTRAVEEWRSKRGRWFKFDDENVTCASESQAQKGCFGRESNSWSDRSQNDLIGTMSSAYMLVYVREHDANEIMCPITDATIPTDLKSRLLAEEMKVELEERLYSLNGKEKTIIRYVTPTDAAQLSEHSFDIDFVDTSVSRQIVVTRGSKKLAVLLKIARALEVPPDAIRLWLMRRRNKRSVYRPCLLINSENLNELITIGIEPQDVLYVEFLESKYLFSDRALVSQTFLEFDAMECIWKDRVVAEIKKCFPLRDDEEEAIRAHCGVGLCDSIISILAEDEKTAMAAELEMLFQRYCEALDSFSALHGVTELKPSNSDVSPLLIIFKIFDPLGTSLIRKKRSNDATLLFHSTVSLSASDSMTKLFEICDNIVTSSFNATERRSGYIAHQVTNPRSIKVLDRDEETLEKTLFECDLCCGDIICLECVDNEAAVLRHNESLAQQCHNNNRAVEKNIHTPEEYLVNVQEWLKYQADRMVVQLCCGGSRDADIVMRKVGAWRLLDLNPPNGSIDANPWLETSSAITGRELLSKIARITRSPSYKYLAVSPSESFKQDQKKSFDPISEDELDLSVLKILRSRSLTQSTRYLHYYVLPFDDILYQSEDGSEESDFGSADMKRPATPPEAGGGSAADEGEANLQGDELEEMPIAGKRLYQNTSDDGIGIYQRYPEVFISDTRMKALRSAFTSKVLLSKFSVLVENKKRRVDPKNCIEIEKQSLNTDPDIVCEFPAGIDVLHDGYVEVDRMYVKFKTDVSFALVSSLAAKIKLNLCPGFMNEFRVSHSIIRASAGSDFPSSGDEHLPLTPREIFQALFPSGQYSFAMKGLADTRQVEKQNNWYRQSQKAMIIDFFSEETASIMELAYMPESSLMDSREPLLLLCSGKKKIKTIFQHHWLLNDHQFVLPRSWIDYISDCAKKNWVPPSPGSVYSQFVTREDELFMRGLHPRLRSMMISVFCFTLHSLCAVAAKGPIYPCISYVTEVDSYQDLYNRILSVACFCESDGLVDGSEMKSSMRLCAIKDEKPLFLPLDDEDAEMHGGDTPKSVWGVMSRMNPEFDFSSKDRWLAVSTRCSLIEVGIMLPSSPIENIRKRRSGTAGIKIR